MMKYYLFCSNDTDSEPWVFKTNGEVQTKIEQLLVEHGMMVTFTVIKGEELIVDIRPTFHVSVGGQ